MRGPRGEEAAWRREGSAIDHPPPGAEPARPSPRTDAAAALLGAMLVLVVLREFASLVPRWLPGAAAWLALPLLWPRISRTLRVQTGALAGIGTLAFLFGDPGAAGLSAGALFGYNDTILAMLAAVSFLRLLPAPGASGRARPRGAGAFLHTALTINLLGALTNISGMVIVGDRLARGRPLPRREALLLCRSFCTAVFYSPFIGGMALALHYAPGARLFPIMSAGIVLALAGIVFTCADERRRGAGVLSRFEGYPLRVESLVLPALLALAVLAGHAHDPDFPVLVRIAALAPLAAWVVSGFLHGPLRGTRAMVGHGRSELPRMAGEVALFLAAGTLAAGLSCLFAAHGGMWVPASFDATVASLLVCAVGLAAFAGVHPVAPLTVAATLFAPLHPDPTLMVMSFVMGWGIGCAGNPCSGQVLTLQARYAVPGWRFPRWNALFCATLGAAGALVLHFHEWLGR